MKAKYLLISTLLVFTFIGCKDDEAEPEPKIDLSAAKRSLVSCFPFNGNANDSQGLNNGNVIGATLTEDRFGKPDSAYNFDGNDRIEIPTNQLINNEFTWSVWIKPTSLPRPNEIQVIITVGGVSGDASIYLNNSYFIDTDGRAKVIFGNHIGPGEIGSFEPIDDVINENQWYFISVVRSKEKIAVYINGALKSEMEVGGVTAYLSNTLLAKIGSRSNNAQNFVGSIDDVMFFKTTLTSEEIEGLYKAESCDF